MMERLRLLSAFQVLSTKGAYGVSAEQARSVIRSMTGIGIGEEATPPPGLSVEHYLEWLQQQQVNRG